MADVFNAEVVALKVSEGAAYGSALQALWCWRLQQGDNILISDLTDKKKNAVAVYDELQAVQDELSRSLRGVFTKHRRLM